MFLDLKGLDWKKIVKNIFFRVNDDDILALGSQLAYSLVFAFFPFLIFLLTMVSYSPISRKDVVITLSTLFPEEVYKLIDKTVNEIFMHSSRGLMSFSIIVMLWTSSNGFSAVIKGLNKAYDEEERRSFFKIQLVALLCTVGLTIILIFSILLLVFGETNGKMISSTLGLGMSFSTIWNIFRYIFALLIMTYIFALLYRYTPSRRLTFKEVYPGAIFTTIGWVVASVIFSFYIKSFGNYSRVYGSIGAVIIFLTWLFIISIILLLGGELNASIMYQKKLKGLS